MNKIIPKLRFKEFNLNWETKYLKEYLEFKNGLNGDSNKFGSGIRCISVMDILKNQFITYDIIKGQVDIDNTTLNNYSVNYGDILFQRSSENIEDAGSSNVYLDKEKIATFGGFVIRGKKINEYNPYFMNMLLKTLKVRKNIMQKAQGAQHINISQEILEKIKINIPLINEQNKIACIFELLDKKIELQKQKIENLKLYKSYILYKLFQKNIDWKKFKLKDICSFYSGGTPLSSNKNFYNGNIPFIRSGEIHQNYTELYISQEGLQNSSAKMVTSGDILYALYGATSGDVAISHINGAINQAILCIKPNMNHCNNLFIMNYLLKEKSNIIKKYLQGGQGNLSAEIIKNLDIYLPNLDEQIKISNVITIFNKKIKKEECLFKSLIKFKKSLLQKMFI